MNLTETEPADLRAKAEAATPGPWFAIDSIRNKETYIIPGDTEPTFDNEENSFAWGIMVDDPDEGYSIVHGENYHSIEDIQQDIDFIAAANPTTILSLLDEIERLRAENNELRLKVKMLTDDDRQSACVNALAGIADPDAFMAAVDAVFKEFYGANATILPITLAEAIDRLRVERGQHTEATNGNHP